MLLQRERSVNVAHLLTFLRILLTPLFPILYLCHGAMGIPLSWVPYLLILLLLICEGSDWLDGVWARRNNRVTDLGKVLDPMADSVTHITLFLTFTRGIIQLPLPFVFIFLYRELFMTTLRTLCALKGFALSARWSGKMKAALQGGVALGISFSIIPYTRGWISLEQLQNFALIVTSAAALYTLLSAWDYVRANWIHIRSAFKS